MFDITPSQDYVASRELQSMDGFADSAILQFKNYSQQAYNAFWFGEVSPIIKIEKLGTQAINVFTRSAQGQAFIKSVDPSHTELGLPEGYSIEWNADGSGTMTYTAPIIPEPPVIQPEPVVEETPETPE